MNIEEAIDIIDKELHKKWDKQVEKKDGMTYIHLGDEEPLNEFEKASQRCLVEVQSLNREIERLKEEYVILQNASDEVEEEKDKEIERLNNIINKAIEYIEKNSYTTFETIDDINYFIVRLDKCYDLLDILKGVDKE